MLCRKFVAASQKTHELLLTITGDNLFQDSVSQYLLSRNDRILTGSGAEFFHSGSQSFDVFL